MSGSKLILIIILGVVLLALGFLAVVFVNQSGEDFNTGLSDNIKNAAVCSLNFVNNDCSLESVDSCRLNENCILCEGEEAGGITYRCELKVCGCGTNMREATTDSDV